uniref:Kazal-like domain-containing protein n=1 Tax=Eptatretus burgeri TaxID=7764 RepID=A0A8C4RCS4_EPTBU
MYFICKGEGNVINKRKCNKYRAPNCHRAYIPLCGTDQKTYPNECILCVQIRHL